MFRCLCRCSRMAAIRRGGELPPLLQQQIRRSPEQAITMHLWPYMQRLTAYAADADEIVGRLAGPTPYVHPEVEVFPDSPSGDFPEVLFTWRSRG